LTAPDETAHQKNLERPQGRARADLDGDWVSDVAGQVEGFSAGQEAALEYQRNGTSP